MTSLLRRVTGVNEGLLAQVPELRPQYARLGGVVIGTASIAALSMWLALGEIAGHSSAAQLIPAVLWGLFIANLDAWIISSMSGTHWRSRPLTVAPRIAIAIVFGVLIAEPLLLRVFQTAVEARVKQDRQGALLRFQSQLVACNPESGVAPSQVVLAREGLRDCQSRIVEVKGVASPVALQSQIANAQNQLAGLQRTQRSDAREQASLNTTARLECSGAHGRGLSGVVGAGINCQTDRQNAQSFRDTTQPGNLDAQIQRLSRRITTLQNDRRVNANVYAKAVQSAITEAASARRRQQQSIGLLERLDALHALVQSNWYVGGAQWFLRIFFITIDCLPLIVKLMSGVTAYDRLFDERLASEVKIFVEETRTEVRRKTADWEVERYALERQVQDSIDAIDTENRLDNARREAEIFAAVDDITQRALRRDRPRPASRGRPFERSQDPSDNNHSARV